MEGEPNKRKFDSLEQSFPVTSTVSGSSQIRLRSSVSSDDSFSLLTEGLSIKAPSPSRRPSASLCSTPSSVSAHCLAAVGTPTSDLPPTPRATSMLTISNSYFSAHRNHNQFASPSAESKRQAMMMKPPLPSNRPPAHRRLFANDPAPRSNSLIDNLSSLNTSRPPLALRSGGWAFRPPPDGYDSTEDICQALVRTASKRVSADAAAAVALDTQEAAMEASHQHSSGSVPAPVPCLTSQVLNSMAGPAAVAALSATTKPWHSSDHFSLRMACASALMSFYQSSVNRTGSPISSMKMDSLGVTRSLESVACMLSMLVAQEKGVVNKSSAPLSLTVLLLEDALYFTAPSLQVFSDLSTICERTRRIAAVLSKHGLELLTP